MAGPRKIERYSVDRIRSSCIVLNNPTTDRTTLAIRRLTCQRWAHLVPGLRDPTAVGGPRRRRTTGSARLAAQQPDVGHLEQRVHRVGRAAADRRALLRLPATARPRRRPPGAKRLPRWSAACRARTSPSPTARGMSRAASASSTRTAYCSHSGRTPTACGRRPQHDGDAAVERRPPSAPTTPTREHAAEVDDASAAPYDGSARR